MGNGSSPNALRRKDIWDRGVETIMNWCKRSLLEYVESLMESSPNGKERDRLIRIKKAIHQDCTQAQFQLSTLFMAFRTGGSIEPFEDILRPENVSSSSPAPTREQAEALLGVNTQPHG